tara:strand:+ start:42 stop:653 length:612 start_codon:yes stop_codon:yes gene_type:complete
LSTTNVNSPSFWNSKYINKEHGWDIGEATPIFKNWSSKFQSPENINICIPGCGYGHDAIYLANAGFNVYAFDFSKDAINILNSKMTSGIFLKTYCIDFFKISDDFLYQFDFILEYTFYCAISPSKRLQYVDKCHGLLKEKGRLISIMLQFENNRGSNGPPFQVTRDELTLNFEKKFNVIKIEKSNLSIEPRKDIELYVEYEKK